MLQILARCTGALLVVSFSAACGDAREPRVEPANVPIETTTELPSERRPIDASRLGAITGEVVFGGVPSAREALAIAEVGGCRADGPVLAEHLIVNDGKVANVLVRLGAEFDRRWIAPVQEARRHDLAQQGCMFVPHVLVLRVGDELGVANDDACNHNVNFKSRRRGNPDVSHTQAPGAPALNERFGAREVGIEIVCDLHPWMKAWVHVLDHPFFALTDAQGRFSLSGVPSGDYSLELWHETLGKATLPVSVRSQVTTNLRCELGTK